MKIELIVMALILSYVIPFGTYLYETKHKKNPTAKWAFITNGICFFAILILANLFMFHTHADAQTALAATATSTDSWRYFAASLSTGLSCIGAGIAVASAASAALGALSENSGIMGKALIFVALAESIALYGVLISFSILNA